MLLNRQIQHDGFTTINEEKKFKMRPDDKRNFLSNILRAFGLHFFYVAFLFCNCTVWNCIMPPQDYLQANYRAPLCNTCKTCFSIIYWHFKNLLTCQGSPPTATAYSDWQKVYLISSNCRKQVEPDQIVQTSKTSALCNRG